MGARNRRGVTAEKREVNASGLLLHMLCCAGVQPCQAFAFTSRRDTTSCLARISRQAHACSLYRNSISDGFLIEIPANRFRNFFPPNWFLK